MSAVLKEKERMSEGYGIIPKMPMTDTRLTIEAKAIYAYLCSYAGKGATAFPSVDKILYDMQICSDRYYKHIKLLKEYGYVEIKRNPSNGRFSNNIYTLNETIQPCPENKTTVKSSKNAYPNNMEGSGRMSLGYGVTPKMVMTDTRLTIEAKAIYAYLCSYAGKGTTAFPTVSKILYDMQISKPRYYNHIKLLKEYGYVEVKKNSNNSGKFCNNIYKLNEIIKPCPKNNTTVKSSKNTFPYFKTTVNLNTVEVATNNNNNKNNNFKNNSIKSESKSMSAKVEKEQKKDVTLTRQDTSTNDILKKDIKREAVKNTTDQSRNSKMASHQMCDNYNTYLEIVKSNIKFDEVFGQNKHKECPTELVEEIVYCICDVITTNSPTVRIGKEMKSRNLVKDTYLKINNYDIEHFIKRFNNVKNGIKHMHSYIKTSLYNIKLEKNFTQLNELKKSSNVDNGEKPRKEYVKPQRKVNRFVNFKQRDWDYDEIERLERKYLERSVSENKLST